MDKLFRNMIAKTQANMEASYRDICIRNDVDEGLRKLEKTPPVLSTEALLSTEDPLTSTVAELRRVESENLKSAIKSVSLEQRGGRICLLGLYIDLNLTSSLILLFLKP